MRKQELSKLMYYMASMDEADRNQFRDYLHSPVFNKKEEPRLLYSFILQHCLGSSVAEIADEAAIQVVWPGGNGNSPRLQKLKTALMNLYFSFLEFQHWERSPILSKVGLLHRLNDIHDESYFEHYYRNLKKEIPQLPYQDLNSLTANLELEMEMIRHQLAHGGRSKENHLDLARKAMERVVQGKVLEFAFLIANQRQIVGAQMPEWIQSYMANLQFHQLEGEPLLEIYFLLYLTLDPETNLAQFILLKEKVLAFAPKCSLLVADNLFTGTLNNFSRFSQRTGFNLLEPIFELYQSMVETLQRKGAQRLNRPHFKNIVLIGARLGQFEWVKQFISEASKWLEGEAIETTLDYNKGVLHFYQKEYSMAKRFLNKAIGDANEVFYEYDGRLYLLMCLYETGDSLGMESLVHSFRMLLGRSGRISEKHKRNYLGFVRLFRKMLGIPLNDQFRLQQLKAEIERLTNSAAKSWLLEKVEQLLN